MGQIDPGRFLPSADPRTTAAGPCRIQDPLDVLQLLLQFPAVIYRRI